MATKAGWILGVLQQMTHWLTAHIRHIRSVMACSPLHLYGYECSSNHTQEAKQHPGYSNPLDGTPSTILIIQSLFHCSAVAAEGTVYKRHCWYLPKLLWKNFPDSCAPPTERIRGEWEHHQQQIPFQIAHHLDLQIFCCFFIVAGSISLNSLLWKHIF